MAYVYQINSDKGKQIANSMKSGSTYKASDGSTWTKNSNGSISVTTASGNTYASNYSGGSNSSSNRATSSVSYTKPSTSSSNKTSSVSYTKPSVNTTPSPSGSGGGGSSNVSVNTSTNNIKNSTLPNQTITSNQSYNGNYITFNMQDDYKALMDAAAAKGDYASAAKYEAARNAKLDYLNQQNGTNYAGTTNYLNVYRAKNAQGGTVYEDNGSLSNLKTGINNVNGAVYRKDDDGRIYQATGQFADGSTNWTFVGDGINPATGEFTFSNVEDAKRSYLDSLYSYGAGEKKYSYSDPSTAHDSQVVQDAWDYYNRIGIADPTYVENLATGTTGPYMQVVIDEAKAAIEQKRKEEEAREMAIQAMLSKNYNDDDLDFINQKFPSDGVTLVQTNPETTLPPTVTENSFESDDSVSWDSYYRRRLPTRGRIQ